jgi:hypothetical protein
MAHDLRKQSQRISLSTPYTLIWMFSIIILPIETIFLIVFFALGRGRKVRFCSGLSLFLQSMQNG